MVTSLYLGQHFVQMFWIHSWAVAAQKWSLSSREWRPFCPFQLPCTHPPPPPKIPGYTTACSFSWCCIPITCIFNINTTPKWMIKLCLQKFMLIGQWLKSHCFASLGLAKLQNITKTHCTVYFVQHLSMSEDAYIFVVTDAWCLILLYRVAQKECNNFDS